MSQTKSICSTVCPLELNPMASFSMPY